MVRKQTLVGGGVAGLIILTVIVWFGFNKHLFSIGCPSASDLPPYTRWGMQVSSHEALLFVSSNLSGVRGKIVPVSDYSRYQTSGNILTVVASQSGIMDYFLGYFDTWQNIPGSTDKLMAVKSKSGSNSYFRVAFKKTPDWGENPTLVRFGTPKTKAVLLETLATDGQTSRIHKNDAVLLYPGFFLPEYQKKDDQGHVFVSEIIDYGCNPGV